ncbi:MAG: hypothetical protein ACHREM_18445, partial [Polyangiales bacterium]
MQTPHLRQLYGLVQAVASFEAVLGKRVEKVDSVEGLERELRRVTDFEFDVHDAESDGDLSGGRDERFPLLDAQEKHQRRSRGRDESENTGPPARVHHAIDLEFSAQLPP